LLCELEKANVPNHRTQITCATQRQRNFVPVH
jgi:hypothetical protein